MHATEETAGARLAAAPAGEPTARPRSSGLASADGAAQARLGSRARDREQRGAPDCGPELAATVVAGLRNETELERYDRNLNELLGELRVALPGVQVLFAFLLVAPFNQRFSRLNTFERQLYLVALLSTLLAAILLVAPTLIHRFHFRLGEKAYVVHAANRLMVAGLSVFALAMTIAVLLITLYLFGSAAAIGTTAVVATAFGIIWFALPLRRRRLRRGLRAASARDPA